MNRLTFTAGIGEDYAGNPLSVPDVHRALAAIRGHLANTFGGYTETAATGGWVNGEGRLVMEPAVRWTVLSDSASAKDAAASYARVIGHELRQASVVVEVEQVHARFVDTAPETIANAA